MKIIRCCVFLLPCLILHTCEIFADSQKQLDWDRIVVSKSRVHLIEPYSLSEQSLFEYPFTSAIETLSTLPVDLQSRSPVAAIQTDFSLRGSNFQDVLILLSGQRINDPQTAHHNSDLPLTKEDIENVDLLPGVSSSVFGADAVGGALNFILKKPKERGLVFEATGGDFKSFSGLFSATEKFENLGVRLSVENNQSAGFREDTDFKKFTTSFASTLDLPNGEFDLDFGYQDKEFGAYDFYTPGKGYLSKEWTETYLVNTGLNINNEGFVIKPNLLWRRHFDKFALDKTQVRSNFLSHHRTDMITPSLYLQKETKFIGRVGFGIEYGQEKIVSTTLGNHTRDHRSIYMDDSYDIFERLSSGLSLRFDDYDSFGGNYTGSATLRYEFTPGNFAHLGLSRSIRVPSFTELYYSDPTTVGDSGLSAEKSLSYEVGYENKKDGFLFGLTLFLRKEDDFIDWVKFTPSQVKWQAANIPGADVFGVEERLNAKINDLVDLNSNYTYINKYSDTMGYLYKYGRNYAVHMVNTEFIFKLPFGVQSLGFSYKKKPDRRGWLLVNTRLSHNFNKNTQVFFAATNLLNVEYQEIEGIPQPGRWINAGLRLEW